MLHPVTLENFGPYHIHPVKVVVFDTSRENVEFCCKPQRMSTSCRGCTVLILLERTLNPVVNLKTMLHPVTPEILA